jgi:colanic acid biosynthesis glycosyl transferase WcaI
MHVAILTQYYPPEMGAPQARLSGLARNLVSAGHKVTVLTAMPNYPSGKIRSGYGGLFRKEEIDGISVIRTFIYPTKTVALFARLASYFSFVLSSLVLGSVFLPRVDYLITESPPLFLGIAGFLLSRFKGARWIFNVSDLWPESAVRLGVVSDGLGLRLATKLEAFCYRKAWLVTGQSREILSNIHERFPAVSTYHLSNGVDTEAFGPGRRSAQLRAELGGDESCIALYAGLHGIAQGLDQILDAAVLLGDLGGLRIIFAGDGPEQARLASRCAELGLSNVRFLGALDREQMPGLLASADVALVPLKSKLPGAVPSKIYEAMGSGIPVVLVADGEAADIITRSGAGIVVGHGDIRAIADALKELAENEALRKQMGEAGRQAATLNFDRKAICDSFARLLEGQAEAASLQAPPIQVMPQVTPQGMPQALARDRADRSIGDTL